MIQGGGASAFVQVTAPNGFSMSGAISSSQSGVYDLDASAGFAVPSGVLTPATGAVLYNIDDNTVTIQLGTGWTDFFEVGGYAILAPKDVETKSNEFSQYSTYLGVDKAPGQFFTDFSAAFGPKCFPSSTPILLASGATREICDIRAGDVVLAFDGSEDMGRGALAPKRVVRLYRNETTEWVRLSWGEGGEARELVVTPGHRFLTERGTFEKIGDMAAGGRATVVLEDGALMTVAVERIMFSAETA